MMFAELDALISIRNGTLTLAGSTLPGGALEPHLRAWNGDLPIVIAQAQKKIVASKVTVTGSAPFLGVPSLAVSAEFTLDPKGAPVATLRFSLIGDTPGPNAWRFSQSFPGLPGFAQPPGILQDDTNTPPHFLDTLLFFDAAFVLTTGTGGKDATLGAPLVPGLNFVARLRPTAILGLLDTALGGDPSIVVHASIVAPQPTLVTPPLPPLQMPWQVSWPLPGILLKADLGIDLSMARSKLRFHDTAICVYIPPAGDWTTTNRTYFPVRAVIGVLDVPSAGIQANLFTVEAQPLGGMTLVAWFDGLKLADLAHLADLANGQDLFNLLPDDVKAHGAGLGGLELEEIRLTLGSDLVPTEVQLMVGMSSLQTHLFPDFTLTGISAQFTIDQPFATGRTVTLTLGGDMTLAGAALYASINLPGASGTALLKSQATLPLSALFKQAGLPAPADLTIDTLELSVGPGATWNLAALFANSTPWNLALGPQKLEVQGLQLALAKGPSGYSGSFSGLVSLSNELELSLRYDLPGSFQIRADVPSVKLSTIMKPLDQLGVPLPNGFDLDLQQTWVLIQEQGGALTFSAATSVAGVGLLALTAQSQGQWGMAIGIDIDVAGLANLPGLGALARFNSFVGLDKMMLVLSSLNNPGFQFPDMAAFNAPPLGNGQVKLPAQASGVVRGVNLYAQVNIGQDKAFSALAKYLGLKLDGTLGMTLAVSLPDPTANSKLFVSVKTTVSGVTINGEMGLLMSGGEPGAFLSGNALATVQGQALDFNITTVVVPDGVLISGSVTGGPIQFKPLPVQVSNLGLVIGLDLEGVPSLGFMGTLDVAAFNSSVAVFLDSTDPARSLVAGSVSPTNLLQVVQSIAGQATVPAPLDKVLAQVQIKGISAFSAPASLSTALDARDLATLSAGFKQYGSVSLPATSSQVLLEVNTKGSLWHLTDLTTMTHYTLAKSGTGVAVTLDPQLYCAPENTFIGAQMFPQGLHVVTRIDYLLLDAQIQVLVSPTVGISVDTVITPIVVYKPSFFSVTDATGQKGPLLSIATYNQPSMADPNLRPPHVLVTGAVTVLGHVVTSVYLSATTSGLAFAFTLSPNAKLSLTLSGSFTSLNNVSITGSVSLGLQGTLDFGALGSLSVNVSLASGSFALSWDGKTPSAKVTGSVTIPVVNQTFSLSITLDPSSATGLEGLAAAALSQIQSFVKGIFADPKAWLGWVAKGVMIGISAAKQVGQILASQFHMAGDAIAQATKQALNYTADEVGQALAGAGVAADDAARILGNMYGDAGVVTHAIQSAFTHTHADTSFGHIDTPGGPHTDVGSVPHGDTKPHIDTPKGPHTDVGSVPHGDTTPHIDTPAGPHVDSGSKHIDTPHGDIPVVGTVTPHGDTSTPHADFATPPHGDTHSPHIDTPGTPHADFATPPHGDTQGPHVDTPGTPHADFATPPHGDTHGPHADTTV